MRKVEQFSRKTTVAGHDTYAAWRDGQHDDLVLALALALWGGEQLAPAPLADDALAGFGAVGAALPDDGGWLRGFGRAG